MRAAVALLLASITAVTACGHDDDNPPVATAAGGGVAIVEVIDDVEYYIGCANESVLVDDVRWYPVADWGNIETADLYERITKVDRERPTRPVGFARVAPPGPGDGVGTLYVYADGYGRYESVSGQTIWLTTELLEYDWIC